MVTALDLELRIPPLASKTKLQENGKMDKHLNTVVFAVLVIALISIAVMNSKKGATITKLTADISRLETETESLDRERMEALFLARKRMDDPVIRGFESAVMQLSLLTNSIRVGQGHLNTSLAEVKSSQKEINENLVSTVADINILYAEQVMEKNPAAAGK